MCPVVMTEQFTLDVQPLRFAYAFAPPFPPPGITAFGRALCCKRFWRVSQRRPWHRARSAPSGACVANLAVRCWRGSTKCDDPGARHGKLRECR